MLVYQQEISGIIDWDATCAGDAAFDLATLLFYASAEVAIREQLWQHILRRTPLSVVSVYLAHLILRQVIGRCATTIKQSATITLLAAKLF
jgi:thiamine kinase-like enzyme